MARWILALLVMAVLATCANAPPSAPSAEPAANVPTVATIVCEADGTITVETPVVVVQPDGVHVHVVSKVDEPASVDPFGRDVDPGETRFVSLQAPGQVDASCWPFSRHGSGREPPTSPIELLDPNGVFVDGEIRCDGQATSFVADYFQSQDDAGPVPLERARRMLRGLDPDDQVLYAGYPEAEHPGVIVVREGRVIGSFSFARFDGEWGIPGGSYCFGVGIGLDH